MTDDARELLTKIGHETSLRYSIQLITASAIAAKKRKSAQVDIEDISRAYSMFVDVKRSTQFLIEYQDQYMFNEVRKKIRLSWFLACGVYGLRFDSIVRSQ